MRVLLLGPYPPPYGGVQTHITGLCTRLREGGHTCDVVNITRHREATDPGVHHPRSAVGVIRLLWTLSYDILHLHVGGDLPPRVVALAFACTAARASRTVFTFHSGGYPRSPAGRRLGRGSLPARVFRRFDAVIGVNEELCAMFRRVGVPAGRVHRVVPYLPPRGELTGSIERPDVAEFVAAHHPLLCTVGLLEPEYDLELQIKTLGAILTAQPDAGLLIIGSGSLESALRDLIAAQPWAARICLAGDVSHSDTLKAIGRSDLLLRTTHYDGDAISVREALSIGTPVLATDNGMRPAGVHLLPRADSTSLASAVDRLLDRPKPTQAAADADATFSHLLRIYDGASI